MAGVAQTLAGGRPLAESLPAVVDQITAALPAADLAAVLLWDQAEGAFRPRAASGPGLSDPPALFEIKLREGESITGRVYAEGKPLLLPTPAEVAAVMATLQPANRAAIQQAYGKYGLPRRVVAAPLSLGEQKYGVLVLEGLGETAAFTADDVPFVQALAQLLSLALDRRRLEEEAATFRQTRETDRLRAEVMATLSHELRTPLAAIKGYSTALLLDEIEWPDEKRREFLRLIDEECDNLQLMIGEILDSALIDVGQLEMEPEPLRLPRLAREVADEMQHLTERHRFALDFPAAFPIVEADPRRIRQVLRNILDNAIKYSPAGGLVVIRGKVRPADVVISIADQGVGISPEDLIPLFEKYFRVKAPTGYHVPGTGLGLPVSRAIVEAHGGHIWAESKVGEGTTLSFSLPVGKNCGD
ncbi:MAG: ATP-binding protein [Chloroflexota bacterium]